MMSHPVRIQPYISPDLDQKLRAYKAARSLTVSAVVNAALGEYFEKNEVEGSLLVRRLDGVMHAIGQLQRDVDTLAAGFGRFVRYSFLSAPLDPTTKVVRRADSLYGDFLTRVRDQLREGVKFTGQVWRAHTAPRASPPSLATENGGREGGGRS
jgi:hypothetical protein